MGISFDTTVAAAASAASKKPAAGTITITELPSADAGTSFELSPLDTNGDGLERGLPADASPDDALGCDDRTAKKYQTMGWCATALVMLAEIISLGILSLPRALAVLGLVPGVLLIVVLGLVATYTGWVMGNFRAAHPLVHSMADAGKVLLGPRCGHAFNFAQMLFLVLIMGSHIVTFGIAVDQLTGHRVCAIAWGALCAVLSFGLTLPRTLKCQAYFAIGSFISILSAILVTILALSLTPTPPAQAPVRIDLFPRPDTTFIQAFQSTCHIVFAYAGNVAFFTFMSEMRAPQDFHKALYALQGLEISLYLVAAVVIYWFAGPNVKAPAPSSAPERWQKVAYGVALPTIVVAGVINGHVACKMAYLQIHRQFPKMGSMADRTWRSLGTWVAIAFSFWLTAWIIAESIPVFSDLLALISALLGSWFTYGLSGFFGLYLHRDRPFGTWLVGVQTVMNVFCIGLAAAICGMGMYTSIVSIRAHAADGAAWSCKVSW